MELPVQLHSKIGLSLLLLMASCSSIPEQLDSDNPDLKKERGVYFYQNEPYSGLVVERDPQGTLTSEMNLVNGLKQGMCKYWWPNGNLKRSAEYSKGVYHGEVLEFYENGEPYAAFHYREGHESGHQKVWKSDGRIKANYEVIDGRKYGLTGVKNCINVWEEDSTTTF